MLLEFKISKKPNEYVKIIVSKLRVCSSDRTNYIKMNSSFILLHTRNISLMDQEGSHIYQ